MKFYLDKELAKQGIAKCIAISENEIEKEQLEETKKIFNVDEILIFEGEDIPCEFNYNYDIDNIEEIQKLEMDYPQTFADTVEVEEKSIFDESVPVEPNVLYFYIDKHIADIKGLSETKATFDKPLLNPLEYFGVETYLVKGNNVPYYVSAEEGIVREATEYEKYKRGQRVLQENEVVIESRKEIVSINDGQYIENDNVITVELPQDIVKPIWNKLSHIWVETATLEEQLEHYKQEILKANRELLVYEKAGFVNQELQIKLNKLIKKHNDISFDIASEENKFF